MVVCMNSHTKVRTNVSLPADLLKQAKLHRLVLSAVLEEALREKLRVAESEAWQRDNREALQAYAQEVETLGLFSEGLRTF